MSDSVFHVGQSVRFTVPASPAESLIRMTVLELRGDRVLVRSEMGMSINPTAVYPAVDLVAAESYKIPLVNLQTIGASCGYGEGNTRDEAIADALRQAREIDPNAFFEGGSVCFAGGVNH